MWFAGPHRRLAPAIEKVGQDLRAGKSRWSEDVLAIIEEFVGPLTEDTIHTIGTSYGKQTSFRIPHYPAKLIKGSNEEGREAGLFAKHVLTIVAAIDDVVDEAAVNWAQQAGA